ncbi:MAG: PrsW family intramembrane metalloprotease [Candidatus Peregrinibacteria bacterium]|nr:PrsW family intramembrane metalloprotease [Candidatus Peregrinibacteria bacterium]
MVAAKILICFLLACVPAYIWGYIFYKKQPEPRKWIAATFIAGILSVIPIMLYKFSWSAFPSLNIFLYTDNMSQDVLGFSNLIYLPAGVVLAFMFVGILEEYMKNVVVRVTDRKHLNHIDDAIEFCIVAALGFAFVENMMYFFYIWSYQGFESLFISFIFRSIFSTFAHILFSGIYGYYYGMAHFATPILQEEMRQNRHPILKWFHRVVHLKSSTIFAEEKMIEGLVIAMTLHALFNIFLEMGWTFVIVPYLVIGYTFLSYLFNKKENHKRYDRLLIK